MTARHENSHKLENIKIKEKLISERKKNEMYIEVVFNKMCMEMIEVNYSFRTPDTPIVFTLYDIFRVSYFSVRGSKEVQIELTEDFWEFLKF